MTAINQDPKVMEYFPALQDSEKTKWLIAKFTACFEEHEYTFYAVELKENHTLIGFVGLFYTSFEAHFTPSIEIGWRLAAKHWGKGYATEAAEAVLHHAFTELNLGEVVSFAVVKNKRSRRVMEKIGLRRCEADDFDHPNITKDSPLRRHAFYRLRKDEYFSRHNELNDLINIKLEIDRYPKSGDDKVIRDGIIQFNSHILQEKASHFSIFAKNQGEIVGGTLIWQHSDALYIDTLWIAEKFSQQKIGSKLLSMVVEEAKKKGIDKIYVDTFAFQAQSFYSKQGFEIIGRAPGYLLGHDRIFMRRIV